MQHHPPLGIGQHGMKIVGGLRAGAKLSEIDCDTHRQAKEHYRLIEQMWSQIVPNATSGTTLLTPALTHLGAEAIEMRLKVTHFPQLTFVN